MKPAFQVDLGRVFPRGPVLSKALARPPKPPLPCSPGTLAGAFLLAAFFSLAACFWASSLAFVAFVAALLAEARSDFSFAISDFGDISSTFQANAISSDP